MAPGAIDAVRARKRGQRTFRVGGEVIYAVPLFRLGKEPPDTLDARIAIHYGLIEPPEDGNYIDTNLNLAARREGHTPEGCICVSSVVHAIAADALRTFKFTRLTADFKGLGAKATLPVNSTVLDH